MRSNLPFDTEELRAQDRHWILAYPVYTHTH